MKPNEISDGPLAEQQFRGMARIALATFFYRALLHRGAKIVIDSSGEHEVNRAKWHRWCARNQGAMNRIIQEVVS